MVVTVSCSELMAGGMGRMAGIQSDSLAGGITEIWLDSLQAGGLAEMRSDSLDISTYFPILHFLNKIELEETTYQIPSITLLQLSFFQLKGLPADGAHEVEPRLSHCP